MSNRKKSPGEKIKCSRGVPYRRLNGLQKENHNYAKLGGVRTHGSVLGLVGRRER